MKKSLLLNLFLFGFCTITFSSTPEEVLKKIKWYGQSGIRIEAGSKIIWIDPYELNIKDKADIVLITHNHQDHNSASDIKKYQRIVL